MVDFDVFVDELDSRTTQVLRGRKRDLVLRTLDPTGAVVVVLLVVVFVL